MATFGHFALALAWALAFTGLISGVWAGRRGNLSALSISAAATALVGVCATISVLSLGASFLNNDYSLLYVWQFSNSEMDPIYKFTAIWGGMDGSMLLWAAILTVVNLIVASQSFSYPRKLAPWVLAVANSSSLFFLSVVLFLTNPFRFVDSSFIPPTGNGLNPLLQNPYMATHPPLLYLGFTTFSVPFAFCIAAMLSRSVGEEWIRITRRWTLAAWGFLTVGITLGSHWAYLELGWGGFWAWDPVENASFLPWLTGTAYLHSVMVQNRKEMLKIWNIWLVVTTYGLTIFGTFLTRSGIVQSVHAFAETDVGWVFLAYLALLVVGTAILTFKNRAALRSKRQIQSLFSREAAFLLNNLVLLGICFATLWGVMFPVLTEAVTGAKKAVGIPFFNAVNVPLFLILLFLMGVGPLLAWRKASFASVRQTFAWPFLISLLVAMLLVWAGVVEFYPVTAYALSCFATLSVLGEIYRGMKARRLAAAGDLSSNLKSAIKRHRIRYGGYLVHIGVAIVAIAATASTVHKIEREFSLAPNESYSVGRFSLTLKSFAEAQTRNYLALRAEVDLTRLVDGELVETLKPEMRHYQRNDENTSEVALRMGPREDVYLVLAGIDENSGRVAFKLFINPLQVWLWIGALVIVAGTIVVVLPDRSSAGDLERIGGANKV